MDYTHSVWHGLRNFCDLSQLPKKYLDIAKRFANLDLTSVDALMQDRYSIFGPVPRRPADMLRSMMLSAVWGVSSYTEWARMLKTVPFLAVVSGFEPGNTPGVGTFYDFTDRLWLSDENNFSPSVRPKRERPRKPKRHGEKAPPVEKKPVEDVIEALRSGPPDAVKPLMLLFEMFESIFLSRSEREGLIDLQSLTLAGDGTPLYTAARERTKLVCSCREQGISDCSCDRHYAQPDCDWGYDSHRRCYFFGYHLYLLTDPGSKHDLPIFPFLSPASRHDSHSFVHTWFSARSLMPDFHADRVLLDAAHDAFAVYVMMRDENTEAVIDLNKGHSTTQQSKGYSIGPDGVPICRDGHSMQYAGFDKAQHRLKYRCPKMCTREGSVVCTCSNPCSSAKYGRQVHVYPESNPRLFCTPPRGTQQWETAYNARTGSERANKRIKIDYKLEDGRYRSTKTWYCRLFITMMCIHHDAWSPSRPASGLQSDELRPAV